jgi:hypothetical protein
MIIVIKRMEIVRKISMRSLKYVKSFLKDSNSYFRAIQDVIRINKYKILHPQANFRHLQMSKGETIWKFYAYCKLGKVVIMLQTVFKLFVFISKPYVSEGSELWQGWAINHGLNCFYSMNRYSALFKAYGSPEKDWFVIVGLLADNLVKVGTIFCHDSLQAADKAADLVNGGDRPFHPWWWTKARWPGWHEASPGPSHVNAPDGEVQWVQVWIIWRPIC